MVPTTFDSHKEPIPWQSFEPVTGNGAAIILAYGSDGMAPPWDKMIKDHAQALANEGFLALIPDYFRKGKDIPHGNSKVVFEAILTRHHDWQTAIEDAAIEASKLPGIKAGSVGLLGYSLGGFLCLHTRHLTPVLVEFFGPYKFPPSGTLSALSGLGSGANPTLKAQIHHGKSDAFVPHNENALPIEADLKAEGATVTHTLYDDAEHGFHGSASGNAKALANASEATIDFFKANLK